MQCPRSSEKRPSDVHGFAPIFQIVFDCRKSYPVMGLTFLARAYRQKGSGQVFDVLACTITRTEKARSHRFRLSPVTRRDFRVKCRDSRCLVIQDIAQS